MTKIPRIMHTLWVGDKPRPDVWIDSWKEHHPHWLHVLWDEERIKAREWVLQKHIDYMWKHQKWQGVADLCRAEILLEYGGTMFGADSKCLRPVDELFEEEWWSAYASYENERQRGDLLTPILAAQPQSAIVRAYVDQLFYTQTVDEPWQTTGNKVVTDLHRDRRFKQLKIFPSWYLLPTHYTGDVHVVAGDEPYAEHMWGTTTGSYTSLATH